MNNINLKVTPTFKPDDQKRMQRTIKFIEDGGEIEGSVLDIGGENPVGSYIADYFYLEKKNTDIDLDFPNYYFWRMNRKFDNIFMFEVIEHLMNPLALLVKLKKDVCSPETRVFLTYPIRPRFLWAKTHFHEYDKKRFRFMINQAGYRIVRYEQHIHWRPDWWFYFTGLRPFLRLTIGRCRQQFYELALKNKD